MPNRILRESITTSASVDALSPNAELLLYRLIVKADDFGRFHADPTLVLAACFPRKIRKLKPPQVRRWLIEIVDVGTIRLYASDDLVYLWFPKWAETQRSRANTSKFPAPPTETKASGRELLTDDGAARSDDGGPHADGVRGAPPIRSSYSRSTEVREKPREAEVRIAPPPIAADRTRKADELFEPLADACEIDWHHLTPSARGALNAATKALREAGDATPDEIGFRVSAYRETYPSMALTPSALAKHWPALANGARSHEPMSTADRILARAVQGGEADGAERRKGAGGSARRSLPPA